MLTRSEGEGRKASNTGRTRRTRKGSGETQAARSRSRASGRGAGEGDGTGRGRIPRLGLALGGGAARGWAHIGVIRELEAQGIAPDVIGGTSIGALVGGFYAAGRLDWFEEWLRQLDRRKVISYLDVNILVAGGLVEGKSLFDFFREHVEDRPIESLGIPFGAVATDLGTGQEVWLREGSLLEAIRASISLPGFFVPVSLGGRWLVDGGLVNPVPISLCRALGAEAVIAVNVNGNLIGKRIPKPQENSPLETLPDPEGSLFDRAAGQLKSRAHHLLAHLFDSNGAPSVFAVVAGAINIMQERITRSRMAGDPPDLALVPHLAGIGLLEFERAAEAIDEGRRCAREWAPALRDLVAREG